MHSLLKGFRLCHALCILSRSLLAVHAHSVLFLPMQRRVSDTLSQALCNLSLAFLANFIYYLILLLGEVLIQKDEEVKWLQEQLREVEKELGCAREEACSLREELQRVTVELAEKSARVQELERAREEWKESVNWQRKLVEVSLIQSSAAGSNEALLREIKVFMSFIKF